MYDMYSAFAVCHCTKYSLSLLSHVIFTLTTWGQHYKYLSYWWKIEGIITVSNTAPEGALKMKEAKYLIQNNMIPYHHVITLSAKKIHLNYAVSKVFAESLLHRRDIHHHVPPPKKNVPTNVSVMQGLWPMLLENAWVKLNIRKLLFSIL